MTFRLIIITLLLFSCTKVSKPTFVIKDKKRNQAVAIFVPINLLNKHGVSKKEYKAYIKFLMNEVVLLIAESITDLFTEKSNSSENNEQSKNTDEAWKKIFKNNISEDTLSIFHDQTEYEGWQFNTDGTHIIIEPRAKFKRKKSH